MAERLFGMEIEYGFAVRNAAGNRVRNNEWTDRFYRLATQRLPNLPAAGCGGMFLQNGARFYMDCGHPEMTTPECANPWDVVRYMLAGEKMLLRVAGHLKQSDRNIGEVLLFKTNVDHSGSGATWGCHTSFLHRANPADLPAQIIPHLVSRIIYTGAGGIEAGSDGLHFTLSPRVAFLERPVSDNSTSARGIFHTKDEALSSNGFHRLHIICGESLCSETALWLNMGATALIMSLMEMGLKPGTPVQLANPLTAMQRFAADPTCTATATTCKKARLTAIQIQRHYLELAERHMRHSLMPPWADRVCEQWRLMLDRLEHSAPASVATTLDWAIKHAIFSDRLARRGLAWAKPESTLPPSLFENNEAKENPTPGLPVELHKMHQELAEIDTRFGQIGESGIFATLDRADALSHRFAGTDNLEHALANPPSVGRARLRGECVQRYAQNNSRYSASWQGVFDREKNLSFDLSHPFTESAQWEKTRPETDSIPPNVVDHLRGMLNRAKDLLDRGQYEATYSLLHELAPHESLFDANDRYEYFRDLAWVQGRRGFLDSIGALDQLARMGPMTFSLANDYVCAYRFQGLMPPRAVEPWIKWGSEFMEHNVEGNPGPVVPYLDHCGYTHLRNGRPEEARLVLEQVVHTEWREFANAAAVARALADLADACRALGRREEAVRALDEAGRIQLAEHAEGDHADFTLTNRAKLESDPARALGWLAKAKAVQTRNGALMGEARTLLLETRLLRNPALASPHKARILELRGQRPALLQCRLLARILDHWNAWAVGEPDPEGGSDFYWWL